MTEGVEFYKEDGIWYVDNELSIDRLYSFKLGESALLDVLAAECSVINKFGSDTCVGLCFAIDAPSPKGYFFRLDLIIKSQEERYYVATGELVHELGVVGSRLPLCAAMEAILSYCPKTLFVHEIV